MPAPSDPPDFEKHITTGLQDPEIVQALQDEPNVNQTVLEQTIRTHGGRIRDEASREIEKLDELQSALQRAQRGYNERLPKVTAWSEGADIVMGFGFFAGLIVTIILVVWTFRAGFNVVLVAILSRWYLNGILTAAAIMAFALLVNRASARRHRTRLADYDQQGEAMYHPKELAGQVATAQQALAERLAAAVKGELRLLIQAQAEPKYGTQLSVTAAPGLAEIFYPVFEITTSAKAKLLGLLNRMPGGSIGIAGPRGVGKSTLIASLCGGGQKQIGGRPVFSIFTSTPVKYDAREFILHLFSSLCHGILKLDPSWKLDDLANPVAVGRDPAALLAGLRRLARPLVFVGVASLALGLFFALLTALPAPAVAAPGASVPPATNPAPASPAAPTANPTPDPLAPLHALIPEPKGFSTAGVICLLASALTVLLLPDSRGVIPWNWLRRRRSVYIERELRAQQVRMAAKKMRFNEDLPALANAKLREIKFQRSYTSGWSGAIKSPLGLEGNFSQAVTFADQQRSVPELVDDFRAFVALLAQNHAVVIGIDELDKLENDEAAQQFLNEIKSVFNLGHCYYLVSVSESAIHSFERRGLPFRDAFDSAFDTILYVDYLDLDQAKRLIYRRVIGLEVPFIDLCFCLSGGLPRDLIRVCREMLEVAATEPVTRNLPEIARRLVLTDVRAKLRALAAAINRVQLEPESSRLFRLIEMVDQAAQARDTFLEVRYSVRRPRPVRPIDGESGDQVERRERLHALEWEFYAYIHFANTVLSLFNSDLTAESLQTLEEKGLIGTLARVRQNFSVNSQLAMAQLTSVRKALALSVEETELDAGRA